MKHLVSLAAALVAGTLVHATAVHAQAPQGYYVAVPAATPAKTALITRATSWRFQNGAFVADQAPERPEVLCQLVAARSGALTSFSVHGQAFDDAKLAKCNAKSAPAAGQVASTTK